MSGRADGVADGGRPRRDTQAPVVLEIAADDAEDAARAVAHGAVRIELCAALEVGGVTPGPGLLREARAAVTAELVVLARPRRGDFVYDARSFRALLWDVEDAKEHGADGVAVGVLHVDGSLDLPRTAALVQAAAPLPVTVHRAFDAVPDQAAALQKLVELGVRRVLTSGGGRRAIDGAEQLAILVSLAGDSLDVVAGGGVRSEHVAELVARTGVRAVHASASRLVRGAVPPDDGRRRTSLAPSRLPAEDELRRVDVDEVARLGAALGAS